jgi:hypothetical protein
MSSSGVVDPARSWAAEQLGVAAQAAPREARTAFLKRLEQSDFAPQDYWYRAFGILDPSVPRAGITIVPSPQEIRDREISNKATQSLDEFTNQFWKLPPGERRATWTRLQSACPGSARMKARLELLKPGLDIDTSAAIRGTPPDAALRPHVVALSKWLFETFVLSPEQRAFRRREYLTQLTPSALEDAAAGFVLRYYPTIASLDREFVKVLTCRFNRPVVPEFTPEELIAAQSSESEDPYKNYKNINIPWRYLIWMVVVAIAMIAKFWHRSLPKSEAPPTNNPDPRQSDEALREMLKEWEQNRRDQERQKQDLADRDKRGAPALDPSEMAPADDESLIRMVLVRYYPKLFAASGAPLDMPRAEAMRLGEHPSAEEVWRAHGGRYLGESKVRASETKPAVLPPKREYELVRMGIGLHLLFPGYFDEIGQPVVLDRSAHIKAKTPFELWEQYRRERTNNSGQKKKGGRELMKSYTEIDPARRWAAEQLGIAAESTPRSQENETVQPKNENRNQG